VDKAAWQDCKGTMVLSGTYDMAVKMMSDMNFLSALMNFPKEQINDETVELLQVCVCACFFVCVCVCLCVCV
jgi:dynein heavy chain